MGCLRVRCGLRKNRVIGFVGQNMGFFGLIVGYFGINMGYFGFSLYKPHKEPIRVSKVQNIRSKAPFRENKSST